MDMAGNPCSEVPLLTSEGRQKFQREAAEAVEDELWTWVCSIVEDDGCVLIEDEVDVEG